MGFIVSLIVAIIIGWIGSLFVKGSMPGGIIGSMIAGLIGAWIGHGLLGTWVLTLPALPSFRQSSELRSWYSYSA